MRGVGGHAGEPRPGDPRMHERSAARPRGLRQGRVRFATTNGPLARSRSAARHSPQAAGCLRVGRVGDGVAGGNDRGGGAVGRVPSACGRPTQANEFAVERFCKFFAGRGEAVPGRTSEERHGGQSGFGLYPDGESSGLPDRHGRGYVRIGVQDVQGPDRSARRGSGDRHADRRVGYYGVRLGVVAGWRRADCRIPIRRFLDRGRLATWSKRRHLVFPLRSTGATGGPPSLWRRVDDGCLSFGRVRGALVAVPRFEVALSGHAARDLRGAGGWSVRSQPLPGIRAQAALLERKRPDRFRRRLAASLASAPLHRGNRSDAGRYGSHGTRSDQGRRKLPIFG